MLGPLFSEVEVARKHLKKMLGAAKIRVCPIVDTDGEDCLLVVMLPCRPDWLHQEALCQTLGRRLRGLTRLAFGGFA